MKKETLAKLNYVLDSMQLSKEHKATLTDVFNDVSSSGGGVEKFVFSVEAIPLEPGQDLQIYKLNINDKYDVVLDTYTNGTLFNSGKINNEILQYINSKIDCYIIAIFNNKVVHVYMNPVDTNVFVFIQGVTITENKANVSFMELFRLNLE